METINLKYSFLVLIQYDEAAKTLYLTLKSGKQYKYKGFTPDAWMRLKQAQNKGSYIANNVLTGKDALKGEFVKLISSAEISRISNFQKYLAI